MFAEIRIVRILYYNKSSLLLPLLFLYFAKCTFCTTVLSTLRGTINAIRLTLVLSWNAKSRSLHFRGHIWQVLNFSLGDEYNTKP